MALLARPSSHSARPAQARHGACAARGYRAMATRAAAGWCGRWHPTGRQDVGKLTGIARAGKGEGARQGGTDGDALRRRRDDEVAGSAQDGGVLVEGWLR
jgi:hypothetical protein